MRDDRAELVEELFHKAADLPEQDRAAFLDEHCGSDEELRHQVEALLHHEMQLTASFLEPPASGPGPDPIGENIGHYKILEPIGEGGFAVVYLVEQTEPVRRRAALKLIKVGMDTRQVVARFEAERQALALMDHAHVAKVFDAGATETGRPYFVMEHVPGVPITEHCDRQRLDIEGRLKLFMQICDAVQHAHQKGIIHRDLKPSNVLVTIADGQAVPKVIDFGVAKALHQRLTERTLFTEQGQLIGTPEYMSPEQAEMTAQDVDTRSDIYSLGVLLYELLTGALPFDARTLREAGFGEIQRVIREEEPHKPSTRLSSLSEESTTYAQKRRADPRTLLRELRGDLDWITMKALEKDRTRRYATASEMAADLQRHLDHVPVTAGPPSAAYRARKFVRRHKVGVAAAALVAFALLAGAAGTTWQAVRATKAEAQALTLADSEAEQRRLAEDRRAEAEAARDEAEAARQEAERQAEIATAVNEFLNDDLLAAVAPSAEKGKGKDVLMRDVLDVAAERIAEASGAGGRFEDKPLVEASIRQTLGMTYQELGEFSAAEPHLERGQDLRRRALGGDHPDTLGSMRNIANLYNSQGRYGEAEPLYLETLETQRRVLGEEHPETLRAAEGLAMVYGNQGRYDEAEPLYLETLETQRRVLGEEHPDTRSTAGGLVWLYDAQGQFAKAEPLLLESLKIQERVLGVDHPSTLSSMCYHAGLYSSQGRYDEAEPLYLETLENQRRILGEEHSETLRSMYSLAYLYMEQERYAEAEPLFLETIDGCKRVLGEEDPRTVMVMRALARLYGNQGRYEEAEPQYLKTLTLMRRALGGEHPQTVICMAALASVYRFLGRYAEAETLYLETLAICSRTVGDQHATTLESVKLLAELYDAWGKPEQAAEWREKLPASESQDAVAND